MAGFGELMGYGLRLVSGIISDRTKKYWTITFVGYLINLLLYLHLYWPEVGKLKPLEIMLQPYIGLE